MESVILARGDADGFDIALRRRGTDVYELIVNGAFAMDSVDHASEDALADLLPDGSTLVGGLGLGFTANRLLARGNRVDVVELSRDLIDWARSGLIPWLDLDAARLTVHHGDITATLAAPPAALGRSTWDGIALDVDNGPTFLIHDRNAKLYTASGIEAAWLRLNPGGRLAVWCEADSPKLEATLASLPAVDVGTQRVSVARQGREFAYPIYWVDKPS